MEFLYFNDKDHKYQDLFKTCGENDFEHYHCDICKIPYKSKVDALNCCSSKKVKFLEILKRHGVKYKRLLKNIDKLDELFQKIEFGRSKHNLLWGSEYYPFYNLLFLETLQKWDGEKDFVLADITGMGLYNPKDYYSKYWSRWCHTKALEIKLTEEKKVLKRLSKKKECDKS